MQNNTGQFGLILGAVVALVAAVFILGGGDFGGKKTIESDADLPPVTTNSDQ